MSNLNKFALFGMFFMSSILLANGMYSSQIFAQHENVNGTLNEAEINADIEQENKCKKDTECENENEINNQLSITNITTITQKQEEQPELETPCETCFTDNLTPEEISALIEFIDESDINSLQDFCDFIDEFKQSDGFGPVTSQALFEFANENQTVTDEDINNILDCLEEVFGVTFPRPD